MGKKGAKRKTRWRTLSIGSPPGEEDEEEGVHRSYIKSSQELGSREPNGYNGAAKAGSGAPWLKSRHGSAGSSNGSGQSNGGSTTSGYASSGSRSRHDDSGESPTQQPKVIFNEDEYTRITTPRQDMLFKKGYLGQKKPSNNWPAGTASMSATPSTTESQSASHSTADGSEAAEDQQLLDSSTVAGEYAVPVLEAAPMTYGTCYDHGSGYYYEYPMMLVGPAMPEQMGPNIITAMPCAPVPLRPIEWVNPVFVPKLASQQYCYMDYQMAQGTDCAALVDAQGMPLMEAVPPMNGLSNETSLTGSASVSASASVSGSVVDEPFANYSDEQMPVTEQLQDMDLQQPQEQLQPMMFEEPMMEQPEMLEGMEPLESLEYMEPLEYTEPLESLEYTEPLESLEYTEPLESLEYTEPYVETLPPQSLHLAHVMPPPMGQPYLYPGQYMFGSPMIDVNGVTIQSGPMFRCSDVVVSAAEAACAKRRRKKKKKKLKRPHVLGNTEDDDEEEYSSEDENGLSSCRVSWSATTTSVSNRPLNPECQEFHLRSTVESAVPVYAVDNNCTEQLNFYSNSTSTSTLVPMESNGKEVTSTELDYEESTEDCIPNTSTAPMLKNHADNKSKRLIDEETPRANTSTYDNREQKAEINSYNFDDDAASEKKNFSETLTNGGLSEHSRTLKIKENGCEPKVVQNGDDSRSKPLAPEINETSTPINADLQRLPESYESLAIRIGTTGNNSSGAPSKRKYSQKSFKFVREPTPGPDPNSLDLTNAEDSSKVAAAVTTNEETTVEDVTAMLSSTTIVEVQVSQKDGDLDISQNWINESSITSETMTTPATTRPATDEDSGFESQSKLGSSGRPISDAVNEWLKRANSPDLFITSSATSDEDDDNDDENEDASVSNEPSKNLQGNPMPALSVKGVADECEANHSKFANSNDLTEDSKDEKIKVIDTVSLKRTTNAKSAKRKCAKKCKRNAEDRNSKEDKRKNKHALAQEHAQISVQTSNAHLEKKIDGICEFTEKDSDVGMRVAENSRINARELKDTADSTDKKIDVRIRRLQEDTCKSKSIGDMQSVKTFEKGEIVVSMDGELLLVAPVLQGSRGKDTNCTSERRNSNSMAEDENDRSLGSIEEPDVLECWEAETVEPVMTPKNIVQEELGDEDLLVTKNEDTNHVEHVQRYYRLQADSSVTSVEDDSCDTLALNDNFGASKALTVPNTPDQMTESTCSVEEILVIEKAKSILTHGDSKLPIDEAFEAYESYYTGKPLPYTSIDPKLGKSRLFGRDEEGTIPCRAVCCNIQ